jgi:hypothetical protein
MAAGHTPGGRKSTRYSSSPARLLSGGQQVDQIGDRSINLFVCDSHPIGKRYSPSRPIPRLCRSQPRHHRCGVVASRFITSMALIAVLAWTIAVAHACAVGQCLLRSWTGQGDDQAAYFCGTAPAGNLLDADALARINEDPAAVVSRPVPALLARSTSTAASLTSLTVDSVVGRTRMISSRETPIMLGLAQALAVVVLHDIRRPQTVLAGAGPSGVPPVLRLATQSP